MASWSLTARHSAWLTAAAVVVGCGLGLRAAAMAQQPAPPPVLTSPATEQQIQTAIDRAIGFLKQRAPQATGGEGALLALALLKAGVSPAASEIQPILAAISGRVTDGKFKPYNAQQHVYESGVSLMALANADPKAYRPQIEAIANYLVEQQGRDGDWDYPSRTTGDTSMSQYAILGLWEAARAGVNVPPLVWDRAASWHVSRQLTDGGFTYHPEFNAGTVSGGATHSMTVAGTGTLHVVRMHLYPDAKEGGTRSTPRKRASRTRFGVLEPADTDDDLDPSGKSKPAAGNANSGNYKPVTPLASIDRGIAQGLNWLSARFPVPAAGITWKMYFLYGLERTSALADLAEINGFDWYELGATNLVAVQQHDGTWDGEAGPLPSTSFGLLFLTRATARMLNRQGPAAARFGAGLLAGGRGLPENLADVQLDQGRVQVRKLKGPIDELLAELENAQSVQVEAAQTALVESVALDNPEALIGQRDRLLALARDRRAEVRRTAFWALGRTNDLRVAPLLIAALRDDPDEACAVEAHRALQFLSKRLPVDRADHPITAAERRTAAGKWHKWYLANRAYDERDDLTDRVTP